MLNGRQDANFLNFIAERGFKPGDRIPSLDEISSELKISVGKLREQLEVARALGLVEVKPRAGIRLADYSFLPAVRASLLFAVGSDPENFEAFSSLRTQLENAFWHESVSRLTPDDQQHLQHLVQQAWAKLNGEPIQIPHAEHRDLHLTIFNRLPNPFVRGLLEAYWEAYEAVGLSRYSDYKYLQAVWTHHERIVQAVARGDVDEGHRLLIEHTSLLRHREAHAAP